MEITALNTRSDVVKLPKQAVTPPDQTDQKKKTDQPDNTNDNEKVKFTEKQIIDSIGQANKSLVTHHTRLQFSIHEQTKEIMVKVLNDDTGEVIREIPPKKGLDMVAEVWKKLGLLVDERV